MFEVRLSRRARRYYERASTDTAARLDRALGSLEANPYLGDFRIVYEVDRQARVVNVLHILPRGDAYEGKSARSNNKGLRWLKRCCA